MKSVHRKYSRILNSVLLALIPVTVCLLRAVAAHDSLKNVWFCGSNWQDELFYYQLTADVVKHGVPQGFFGFNESTATYLSFSAWSPFLLIFWVIYGLIFGWGIMSPIVCNIVIMTIALFLFAYLADLNFGQTLCAGLLLFVLTPISRFLLSCMAEISVCAVLIVFLGISVAMYSEYRKSYLVWSLILLFFMTLMRPYLVMFALFTFLILIKHKKQWWLPVLTGGISLIAYLLENKYFAPEYFDAYFRTDWITTFFDKGIGAGFSNIAQILKSMGSQIMALIWPGLRYGKDGIAAYYGVYFAMMLLFVALSLNAVLRRKKTMLLVLSMTVMYIGMFLAILLMYKVDEGYRHLLLFIVAGLFILVADSKDAVRNTGVILALLLFTWVFVYKAKSNYFYHVSFADREGIAMIEDIGKQLDANMTLEPGISWDNTVIWVSADYVPDTDEYSETLWRMMYGLPDGFGLNICSAEYVADNIDELHSKYIATVPGGTVENLIAGRGAGLVANNEYFVMYRLR